MSIPKIDPYPPAPTPEDDEATFDEKAYEHAASLESRRVQMNEVATYVNTRAADADNRAVAAAASATASSNSAARSDEWANKAPGSVVASGKYSARHYADLSDKFANTPEDVEVVPGRYSAQHYMEKAKKIADVHATTVATDPLPTVIATNVQEALRDLAYQSDQLRVAKNQLKYGDGPYPALDFQFAGAKYLDPRIQFTRASLDWDEEGKEYGIDEPVITDKGLWVSGAGTNLLTNSKDFLGWGNTLAASLVRDYGQSPFKWGRSVLFKQAEDSTSSPYFYMTSTSYQYTEGVTYTASLYVKPLASNHTNNPIRLILHSSAFGEECRVLLSPDGDLTKDYGAVSAGCEPAGNGFYRIWVTGTAISAGSGWAPMVWPRTPMLEEGEGWEVFGMQLEEGATPTPYIPTEGSQVMVAEITQANVESFGARTLFVDLEMIRSELDNNTVYFFNWSTSIIGNPSNGFMIWTSGSGQRVQLRRYRDGSFNSITVPVRWESARKFAVTIHGNKACISVDGEYAEMTIDEDMLQFARYVNLAPNRGRQSRLKWVKAVSTYEKAMSEQQLRELTS